MKIRCAMEFCQLPTATLCHLLILALYVQSDTNLANFVCKESMGIIQICYTY